MSIFNITVADHEETPAINSTNILLVSGVNPVSFMVDLADHVFNKVSLCIITGDKEWVLQPVLGQPYHGRLDAMSKLILTVTKSTSYGITYQDK